MKFLRPAALIVVTALATGCTTSNIDAKRAAATVTAEPQPVSETWGRIATAADQTRINRVGLAWHQSLAEARPRHRRDIAAEGELLTPRAALPLPAPTPGSYNCRTIRIGKTPKTPVFEKFKPFFCYVQIGDDGRLAITKQTGSQRPAGRLWEDDDSTRMIFLGSLALGDEQEPVAYGDDPGRNVAGVFERIAPFRWRLVIPWPQNGAKIEVFELTPVVDQPE
ncbi:MAG: DUF4893 domain-containing protein [Pseudomonadota bacterium]|nr:DUF4893 domain-containing protein [Sphingomonas sp.]MDQ3477611.1 DUF4893 domain-containing protein [Pseudomonadota bacterium]